MRLCLGALTEGEGASPGGATSTLRNGATAKVMYFDRLGKKVLPPIRPVELGQGLIEGEGRGWGEHVFVCIYIYICHIYIYIHHIYIYIHIPYVYIYIYIHMHTIYIYIYVHTIYNMYIWYVLSINRIVCHINVSANFEKWIP